MEAFNKINENEKLVFFKINEDGSYSISQDYRFVSMSKNGGVRVTRNYRKDYPNQKHFWIKTDYLETTSTPWQETRNKPQYMVRILPIEYCEKSKELTKN